MRIRIGIDVGGTFTHAVAIDNDTLAVVAHAVTPTTHRAQEGVARGIVDAFQALREKLPADLHIVFLAHSTTQATNALLEGDVAQVGILGLGSGLEAVKARSDMNVGPIELAPQKFLTSALEFVDTKAPDRDEQIGARIDAMASQGVGAVVAAEGFSVDDPTGERRVMELAAARQMPACGTHEMSGLYGLRVRTRTAVVNASILPRMIQTAVMTGESLRSQGVTAPLMIMRSDGGVMSLDEVRRRPVLTLLSGPAAGIAAALMFLRATDALFLEVGGTSTDICLIKNGRAAIKSATLGGHPTYLKTLDSRTLGIAGGSMLRRTADGAVDMGPRSAHLAGLHYASFSTPEALAGTLTVKEVSPLPGDPPYLAVESPGGERCAVTTTCAANLLGYVREGDYGYGNAEAVRKVFEAAAAFFGKEPGVLAREMLEKAADKIMPTLQALLQDYEMKDRAIKLLGGGGGAGAIVPFVAQKMGLSYEIAPRAEVISAIGAALAMVKETVEKSIVNPSQQDISAVRAEAERAVIAMGADPDTVEVAVEVDAQKNLVRATATGSIEYVARDLLQQEATEEERLKTLREASGRNEEYKPVGRTEFLHLYESTREEKAFFVFTRRKTTVWVTDGCGNVKLQVPGGRVQQARGDGMGKALENVLSQNTDYGDAGARIPALHMAAGRKLVDLTALNTAEQVTALAREEVSGPAADEAIYFLIHPHV